MRIACIILSFLFSYSASSQDFDFTDKLSQSSSEYLSSFIKEDWGKYIEFTYPNIVTLAGGDEVLINVAEETIEMYKSIGFELLAPKINEEIKSISTTNNIQAIVSAAIILSSEFDKTEVPIKLFAISIDSGHTWRFVDLSQYDSESITQFVPEFNTDLKAFW